MIACPTCDTAMDCTYPEVPVCPECGQVCVDGEPVNEEEFWNDYDDQTHKHTDEQFL
jgi:hypothetical protein